jgi:hypothetical protein
MKVTKEEMNLSKLQLINIKNNSRQQIPKRVIYIKTRKKINNLHQKINENYVNYKININNNKHLY